jgi:HEAT repeat protein
LPPYQALTSGKDEWGGYALEVDRNGKVKWETLSDKPLGAVQCFAPVVRLGFKDHQSDKWDLNAVEIHVRVLTDASSAGRRRALHGLQQGGPAGVRALIRELENSTPGESRAEILDALARAGATAKNAIPAIIGIVRGQDANGRAKAAGALGAIGQEPTLAVPALIAALKNEADTSAAMRMVWALGRFGPAAEEAIPVLRTLAGKTLDEGLKVEIASSIQKIRRVPK